MFELIERSPFFTKTRPLSAVWTNLKFTLKFTRDIGRSFLHKKFVLRVGLSNAGGLKLSDVEKNDAKFGSF